MTNADPLNPTDRQNFKTLKIQDGGGCHFEKIAKSPYLSNGLINCYEFWYNDAY